MNWCFVCLFPTRRNEKRQAQSTRRRDQSHTRAGIPATGQDLRRALVVELVIRVQHHFGRRKMGIKTFRPPFCFRLSYASASRVPDAKVIAERTASKPASAVVAKPVENHQRTGNQGGHIRLAISVFRRPKTSATTPEGVQSRGSRYGKYFRASRICSSENPRIVAVQPNKPPQSENSRPWS